MRSNLDGHLIAYAHMRAGIHVKTAHLALTFIIF